MVFRLIRTARDKENNLGPKDFVKLKIYHISKIDTHNAFDIKDCTSLRPACPVSPYSLCGSVEKHRSAETKGLRFDFLRWLRILSLSQVLAKNNKTVALQATADHSKGAPEINKIYNSIRTTHEKISITCKHKRLQHLLVAMLKCHATPPMVVIGQHSRETLHSGLHRTVTLWCHDVVV